MPKKCKKFGKFDRISAAKQTPILKPHKSTNFELNKLQFPYQNFIKIDKKNVLS